MKKKNYKLYYISFGTCIAIAFFVSLLLCSTIYYFFNLKDIQETKGTIINIYVKETMDMDVTVAEVKYELDDNVYEKSLSIAFFLDYRIGDTVDLFYEKENPEAIRISTIVYLELAGLSFILVGFIIGSILISKNKKWILKQRGGPWPYG